MATKTPTIKNNMALTRTILVGKTQKAIIDASDFDLVSKYNWHWTGKYACKFVGLFKDEDEAARAYNKAAKLAYGKFVFLNQVKTL